ncbi:hypothetical protein [Rhizobium acaciae]|uniref:hypothetical protein n=1 Tax=Rhizobium acaciae TaxID=2989736 RepID=UPI003872ABED
MEPADSAIDLATAFEALLASSDEKTEINYRLKLRASLLLGSEFEDRSLISKHMGQLYTLRSKGVHGGSLAGNSSTTRTTVDWAEKACQQLLRMVVEAGQLPNLKKLELTGNTLMAFG